MVCEREQNRDGQMREMIINECHIAPDKLTCVLKCAGRPITARTIARQIRQALKTSSADIVKLHPETA